MVCSYYTHFFLTRYCLLSTPAAILDWQVVTKIKHPADSIPNLKNQLWKYRYKWSRANWLFTCVRFVTSCIIYASNIWDKADQEAIAHTGHPMGIVRISQLFEIYFVCCYINGRSCKKRMTDPCERSLCVIFWGLAKQIYQTHWCDIYGSPLHCLTFQASGASCEFDSWRCDIYD